MAVTMDLVDSPGELQLPGGGGRGLVLGLAAGAGGVALLVLGALEVLPLHLGLVLGGLGVVKLRLPLGVEREAAASLGDRLGEVLVVHLRHLQWFEGQY